MAERTPVNEGTVWTKRRKVSVQAVYVVYISFDVGCRFRKFCCISLLSHCTPFMDLENVPVPPSQSAPQKNILDFLMLIGKLKHIKRTGWVREKIPDCETVAGHMYRMGIMSFLLDSTTSADINKDRCIKMSLVHDMAECIVGDLTPWCGVSKEEKQRKEQDAMELLCSFVSEEVGKEFKELFQEYEDQQTVEAKAVKDLDRFDMILQAFEYETTAEDPISLDTFFASTEGSFRNQEVMKWVEELKRIRRINLEEQKKIFR